ncbi:MAG: Type 1 glutamine amidotransferase-like domain-containing protein [Pseudomonadota bacterium]
MPVQLLLGPQSPKPILGAVVAEHGLAKGPVAVISAAWQEAEGDIGELAEVVNAPLVNLQLYRRAERIFAEDPDLYRAYRRRQDRLMELQSLYRLRLRQGLQAARQVRRADAPPQLLRAEEEHAIGQVRALDRHHLKQVEHIFADVDADIRDNQSVASAREEIEAEINGCETVIITGGHVLVLLNRLQLFGLRPLLAARNLVAWSAGAMVLSDRVVLYHEEIPQRRRDPELLCTGLGIVPNHVLLPHASRRLRVIEDLRKRHYTIRFLPARCVTLDNGSVLRFDSGQLSLSHQVSYLRPDGTLAPLDVAANSEHKAPEGAP